MARHIASHPVTVTSCDTVPRASRHILPPIRGGGNVTRDQPGATSKGKGGIHLVIGNSVLIVNAKHFSRSTPGPSPDHQRESASAFSCLPAIGGHRTARRIHGRPMGFADGLIFPCASQQSRTPDCPPHNPLRHNKTHRRHHLSDDHKDIYARALSRPLALLEGKARAWNTARERARSPGDRTVAKPKPQAQRKPNSLLGRGKKTRGGRGVPPNSGEPAIIDLIRRFRGLFSQNFFGPLKIPVGRNLARFSAGKVGRLVIGIPIAHRIPCQDSAVAQQRGRCRYSVRGRPRCADSPATFWRAP
jgi:hypothetical protein